MDLLSPSLLDLYDRSWPIRANSPRSVPQYVGPEAQIAHSIVTEGCEIYGRVENSVLSNGVTVEAGALVRYSILMPGVTVRAGAAVEYAILGEGAEIGENAAVGSAPDGSEGWSVATCGPDCAIPAGKNGSRGQHGLYRRGGAGMKNVYGIVYAYHAFPALGELGRERTGASLPFCGRYRLIDFAMSGLMNAGVFTVGVIMQRGYLSLMEHLGGGRPWNMSPHGRRAASSAALRSLGCRKGRLRRLHGGAGRRQPPICTRSARNTFS